jgi:hypothetical protein
MTYAEWLGCGVPRSSNQIIQVFSLSRSETTPESAVLGQAIQGEQQQNKSCTFGSDRPYLSCSLGLELRVNLFVMVYAKGCMYGINQ